jgi:hypothetical protein
MSEESIQDLDPFDPNKIININNTDEVSILANE